MPDDELFTRFVGSNTPSLFRTAFLLTGSANAAEDLLQDTLAHLYPQWHRVESAESSLGYVRRSIANRYVSSRRRREVPTTSRWELPDSWDGRDLSTEVAEQAFVWGLLGTLPARQRAAVTLKYFHDLPDDDIAQALDCRPATVRSLLSRAMANLRQSTAQLEPADQPRPTGRPDPEGAR